MDKLTDKLRKLGVEDPEAWAFRFREMLIAEGAYCRSDRARAQAAEAMARYRDHLVRLHQALGHMPGARVRTLQEVVVAKYRLATDVQAKLAGGELRPCTEVELFEYIDEFMADLLGTIPSNAEEAGEEARCKECHFTVANCRCGKDDMDGAEVHAGGGR